MAPEQIHAELVRTLYHLDILTYDEIDTIVDELTIRLLYRTYDK